VEAVEALVRWRHPQRGLVPPDAFIPTAERTGLIHRVTGWVLNEALQQVRRWQDQGLHLNVAINVSQGDLAEASFQTQVLRALEVSRVPASSLTLEITETAAMHNPRRTAEVLGELRQRGVRISLDDFGTGQASLAHLHNLPVDEIKLDKSFVLDLPEARGQSIARATAMLAREFGLKTVAEGVESAACQRLLGKLGFDQAQGFHLSKPLPAAQLEAWMLQRGMAQAA
jgi:EAL domain-containing protein (putative c-di-GMP-specific phosphodiesterase class I)